MGNGSLVTYALAMREPFVPMRKMFDLFSETTGEQYPVKTFVMDKLATQMRAASAVFGCDVMLCYFHIRNAIRKHECIIKHLRILVTDTLCKQPAYIPQYSRLGQRHVWPSDYNLSQNGEYLTRVPKPPPTALDGLRKQPDRVVNKLQRLEPRRATAIIKQLIVQEKILPYQGPKAVIGGLPSVIEDAVPHPTRWYRDKDVCFRVIFDRPNTISDHWCATDRVSYHIDCCAGEPCPLCSDALQAFPKSESYVVDLDQITESQCRVSRESVCVRTFGSKKELFDSRE
ncbi:hypothetical protein CLF_101295 [Clonorchis sinensis]|uniref:MULE transposase domain-containing protein n=1 Tax=Clonorchis sinensis TaxID=79923 RepID=G7Y5F5_CLOSI|nr:hypothetical protein CLF_101295 [Clonorchis sinensis]